MNILIAESFDLMHSVQFPHPSSELLQAGWGSAVFNLNSPLLSTSTIIVEDDASNEMG